MRYTLCISILCLMCIPTTFGYSSSSLSAANFLAEKGFIVNQKNTPEKYRLDDTISRKEFMKVTMKISGISVGNTCKNSFSDVIDDWGCKYIEAGLGRGFIAKNKNFRPNDNISRLEAIKLVFKSRNIQKQHSELSWQQDYIVTAFEKGLIASKALDYNAAASRGWIFELAAKTFSDFTPSSGNTTSNIGKTEKTLVNGKLEGEYKEYFSHGQVRLIANYVSGQLHGSSIGYYEDGGKNFEAEYKNGKLEGEFVKYYENGVISQRESYSKGLLTGYSYFYDTTGKLKETREYIGGYLLNTAGGNK